MAEKQRSRKQWLDYTIYLVVRVVVCVLQALPRQVAFAFGEGLAWLFHLVDQRHRQVAYENLHFAYPEKTDSDIRRLTKNCYRHCCRLLVEIIVFPRILHVESWRKHATVSDMTAMAGALINEERPALIVTAHFGNWELAGYALGVLGFKTFAIARVLDNPYLETFLKSFRQKTGQTIIAKKDDFDRLTDVLKEGGKVATLADQDAGQRGVFVDFFGRQASAHKAVALMAMEFNAVMVVVGVPRVTEKADRSEFEIVCEEVIDPAEYAGRSDAVKAMTQRYHAALERIIRRNPEQYFWLHRRWKSRPVERKAKKELAPPTAQAA